MERSPAQGFKVLFAAVLLTLLPVATPAQEEADTPADDAPKRITVDLEGWFAQPVGHDLSAATVYDPSNPFNTRILDHARSTENDLRYGLAYRLPGDTGEIGLTYYTHGQDSTLSRFAPGEFVFGEILMHPLFAGVNNDGLADAFVSNSRTFLRDWRLEFRRNAYRSERLSLDWSVGWRRILMRHDLNATYYASFPDFPPLLPPVVDCCPNLDPRPDAASVNSRFEGRGPSIGLRAELPLVSDRFVLETGLNMAILRGDADPSYRSIASYYVISLGSESFLLEAPYDIFGERILPDGSECPYTPDNPLYSNCVAAAPFINQRDVAIGLIGQTMSVDGFALEADIGFRWSALPWLDVTAGFRSSRYDDVVLEVRPKNVTAQPGSTFNIEDYTRESSSISYEGLYGGLRFRFW